MIDEARAQSWEREARGAVARWYGMNQPAGTLACIVRALLYERR
jgi:hypothetical protein